MIKSSKLPKIAYLLAAYSSYQIFLKPAFNLGASLYNHWFRPRANLRQLYGENSYAVVTGATSGIGRAIAADLSREGFNLVLFGRSNELLTKTKEEIQKLSPNCKVEVRKLDLMSQNLQDYREIQNSLQGLDISILVNNAGYMSMSLIAQEEPARLKRMVTTNIGPYVYMTRILLPQLKKRHTKSAIMFTSSVVAKRPTPIIGTYAGTKAFNDEFAQSLTRELQEDSNIDVLSYRPGIVESNMSNQKRGRLIVISPEEAARTVLDKLGQESDTIGSWKHEALTKIYSKILDVLPEKKREELYLKLMKQCKEEMDKLKK